MKIRLKPNFEFSNSYDQARFDLTWRVSFSFVLMLPFLFLSLFLFEEKTAYPALLGWIISLILLVILYLTKSHKIPSIIFTVIGTFLCVFTLIGFPESYHFVDCLWMIVMILYAFFNLGSLVGNICLLANLAGVIYFILFGLNNNLATVRMLSETQLYAHTINVIISGLCIAYITNQFIKTTRKVEDKNRQVNQMLLQKNAAIEQQNEEKTVMLREIHHRVKNNLQVITSLLRLQARELKDEKTVELFKDSTNRVVAMALIHDKMYQNKDFSKINLEDYLKTLLDDLVQSYATNIPIDAKISSNIESINNDALIPLALLFNELVSNSLKHAFHTLTQGQIKIDVRRINGNIILMYWDNGVWREKQKDTSFGLELIDSLTEQLDGKLTRNTNQGTSYEFILPDKL